MCYCNFGRLLVWIGLILIIGCAPVRNISVAANMFGQVVRPKVHKEHVKADTDFLKAVHANLENA
jgi:hypothetical protein